MHRTPQHRPFHDASCAAAVLTQPLHVKLTVCMQLFTCVICPSHTHVRTHICMLQGPLLSVLLQCCSSSSCGVQLLALTALLSLAAVPDNLPAFAKVSPICNNAGFCDFTPRLVCRVHTCMYAWLPVHIHCCCCISTDNHTLLLHILPSVHKSAGQLFIMYLR